MGAVVSMVGSGVTLLSTRGDGAAMSEARNWRRGFELKLIPIHRSSHQLQTGTHEGFMSH